tara:strand:- start:3047 stop:3385 length:339 start_codon:yes stop_codon:yes gene_type:complete
MKTPELHELSKYLGHGLFCVHKDDYSDIREVVAGPAANALQMNYEDLCNDNPDYNKGFKVLLYRPWKTGTFNLMPYATVKRAIAARKDVDQLITSKKAISVHLLDQDPYKNK